MKLKKVAIIGMGLIGGSIGKALMEKGLAGEVIGVCRRQSSLDRAVKEKSLTGGFVNSYGEALPGAEMIFVATPVHTIKEVLEKIAPVVDKGAVVTDVGSVKKGIVEFAAGFRDRFSFVGGHPLAGSEKSGVEYARSDFFQGSLCVLTRGKDTAEGDLEKVRRVWLAMGAVVDVVPPEEHDRVLSFTSHLPHVIAYSLAGIQEKDLLKFASTGFRDTTRIASSDPGLWSDILVSNRENVVESIERFKEHLSAIEDDIREGRREDLADKLKNSKDIRDELV